MDFIAKASVLTLVVLGAFAPVSASAVTETETVSASIVIAEFSGSTGSLAGY